jgi:hypothetical protein
MLNTVSLVMLITIAVLLAWSGARAWRASNYFLKWCGLGLATLLATGLSLLDALMITGLVKLHTRTAQVPDLKVARTSEQIQEVQGRAREGLVFLAATEAAWADTGFSVHLAWHRALPPGRAAARPAGRGSVAGGAGQRRSRRRDLAAGGRVRADAA